MGPLGESKFRVAFATITYRNEGQLLSARNLTAAGRLYRREYKWNGSLATGPAGFDIDFNEGSKHDEDTTGVVFLAQGMCFGLCSPKAHQTMDSPNLSMPTAPVPSEGV